MQLNGQWNIDRFYRLDAGRNETGVEVTIEFFNPSGANMRSLFLASLFVSASAMACPDLSGKYATCKQSDGTITTTDMVITQSVQSGVTVYSTTSTDTETGETATDELITNGNVVSETDELGVTSNISTSCEGDAVVMNVNLQFEGRELGNAKIVTKKEGNALVSRTSGSFDGESMEDVSVCE